MSCVEETRTAAEEIADLPPSCKLVLLVLRESDEALAQGDLEDETFLNGRTTRYALNRLKAVDAITTRPCLTDVRKTLYEIADGADPWGGDGR